MSPILQIFRKELREMLRDKRVRNAALVMPIFLIVMMVSLFGFISASVGAKSKQTVYVVQNGNPLIEILKANPKLEVKNVENATAGQALIKDGKARLVVDLEPATQGQTNVRLLFDPKEDMSQVAMATVKAGLEPVEQQAQKRVLATNGLPESQLHPITYTEAPVVVGEGAGAGGAIVSLMPYLLVLFTFIGGFAIAGDLIAGEKEKSTLETLLISPVPRTDIVLGKFLALCAVCLTSSFSSIIGIALVSILHLPGSDVMFSGGLGLTPKLVITLLVLLLPLVAFFAGLLVAVSTYARNTREAQTYLGTVNLVIMIPAIFSNVLGFTSFAQSTWINFVPVLNTAANIRAAFQGKASLAGVGETVLTGVVLAAIMLKIAVDLFNREQVLVRI